MLGQDPLVSNELVCHCCNFLTPDMISKQTGHNKASLAQLLQTTLCPQGYSSKSKKTPFNDITKFMILKIKNILQTINETY
jgi:hypothetical protein